MVRTLCSLVLLSCAIGAARASAPTPEHVYVILRSGVVDAPRTQPVIPSQPGAVTSPAVLSTLQQWGVTEVERMWPGFDPAKDLYATARTGETVRLTDYSEYYLLYLPDGRSLADHQKFADALESLSDVHVAGVTTDDELVSYTCFLTDPRYPDQWYLNSDGATFLCNGSNYDSGSTDIDAETAWNITTGSSATTLVIMDAPFPPGVHPDFGSRILSWNGTTFSSKHGMHVAGVAAATGCNGAYIRGLDWKTNIHSRRLTATAQELRDIVTVDNSDVSNHSYIGLFNDVKRSGFRDIYLLNHLAVAATGNNHCESPPYANDETYPASYRGPGILAVGGVDVDDDIGIGTWGPFCHGETLDLVAPARHIMTVDLSDATGAPTVGCYSGTSVAAPQASGVATLMLGHSPQLYNDDIEGIIKRSADNIVVSGEDPETGEDIYTGRGRLNAGRALEYLEEPWFLWHRETVGGTAEPTGTPLYESQIFGSALVDEGETVWVRRKVVTSEEVTWPVLGGWTIDVEVWGRGVASTGMSIEETPAGAVPAAKNFSINWCGPVYFDDNQAQLFSYLYELYSDEAGTQLIGTIPDVPLEDWTFAYSVHGQIVSFGGRGEGPAAELSARYDASESRAVIAFTLEHGGDVAVRIHDARGRLVKRVMSGPQHAGGHRVQWDTTNEVGHAVGPGVYIAVLDVGQQTASAKITVVR